MKTTKKAIGRPKSDPKKLKSQTAKVRLTEEETMRIEKSKYGNFPTFVRAMIKKLPLVAMVAILCSCEAPQGTTASTAKTIARTSFSSDVGSIYATSVYIQREYSLGYAISYDCADDVCELTGELHHYRYANPDLTIMIINSATLTKNSAGIYIGNICDNSSNCYAAQVDIANNKIILYNSSGRCTQTVQTASQASYDTFIGSFNPGNISSPAALLFNQLTSCVM